VDLPHAGTCEPEAARAFEVVPKAMRDIAWKAEVRLCNRYRRLTTPGKAKAVVTTPIAREMVGFI
jgi:transposase